MRNPYDPRYMALVEEKLQAIIRKEKKVTHVAGELHVTRQTIHEWLIRYKRYGIDGLQRKRRKQGGRAHNRTPNVLEQLVMNHARKQYQDGVVTLHDQLMDEYNIELHPTTIYRILKRNNIRYTEQYVWTQKRWKKQLYTHKTPGKELQMDTKYPYGYKEGKVIYTIIDDASRWVFAWTYENANAENTIDFLRKALNRAPFTIQKIRTDQGTEFLANMVRAFLTSRNIEHRTNTPYCPEENGKIERFHQTLGRALSYGKHPRSTDELQYRVNLYLHYYNYKKRHRGLGMNGKTPMQKLNELKSVNLTLQCYKFCDYMKLWYYDNFVYFLL